MPKVISAIVDNKKEGDDGFCCGALFAFEPKICYKAAPVLAPLFLNRGIEKCRRIAAERGWDFREYPIED